MKTTKGNYKTQTYLAETHTLPFNSLYMQAETCQTLKFLVNIENKFWWPSCGVGEMETGPKVSTRTLHGTIKTRRCSSSLSLHSYREKPSIAQVKQQKGKTKQLSRVPPPQHRGTERTLWRTGLMEPLWGWKCWSVPRMGDSVVPSPCALAHQHCWNDILN